MSYPLILKELKRLNTTDWAIRFAGQRTPFLDMIDALKSEGYALAHWDTEVFSGKGGWVVYDGVLRGYFTQIEHLQQQMEQEDRKAQQLILDDIRRANGLEKNDCPF